MEPGYIWLNLKDDSSWNEVFIHLAFASLGEEDTAVQRLSLLKGKNVVHEVAESIGLKKLPLPEDSAMLGIRGRLADLFEDDQRASADIVRETREPVE